MLAAKCEVLGCPISRGTLAKIESGIRCVTDIELFALASSLRVPVSEFFPRDLARRLRAGEWGSGVSK